jgi:mannose-1-phosphate guanylyltransferase
MVQSSKENSMWETSMIRLKPSNSTDGAVRCGIVLSAGDGTRLRDFVRQHRGDDLPKQYVNFVGSRSMLEHTWDRAESLIPAQRLFVVIAKQHLRFSEVRRQLATKPAENVIVQPANRETAPGILLPLLHIYKRNPNAIVALFPSDQFVLEEERFMDYVDDAFRLVEANLSHLVLLGLEPDGPDPEYGYIVPGSKIDPSAPDSARRVEMFVEKPSLDGAGKIIARGALWNSLVMVFACRPLLSIMERAASQIFRSFERLSGAIATTDEQLVAEGIYQQLPSLNFSKGVLEALPFEHRNSLLVLPVRGVTWSDWGASDRLVSTLDLLRTKNPGQRNGGIADKRDLRVA